MNLKKLSDEKLIEQTKIRVFEEQKCTHHVLQCLSEISRRRLFIELGFPTLFKYMVKELGYSEAEASHRASALKIFNITPKVESKVKLGKINIQQAAKIQRSIQLAERKENTHITRDKKEEIIEKVAGKTLKETEEILTKEFNLPVQKYRKIVLHDSVARKFDKIKSWYGEMEDEELLEILLDEKIYERKLRLDIKNNKTIVISNSRTIPIPVKRAVYKRAQGQCEYRNCNERRHLQYDHIKPYGLGGDNSLKNVRLLCRGHNQRLAVKSYGANKMQPHLS